MHSRFRKYRGNVTPCNLGTSFVLWICIIPWGEVETEESVEKRNFLWIGGFEKPSLFLSSSKREFSLNLRKTIEDSSLRTLLEHANI